MSCHPPSEKTTISHINISAAAQKPVCDLGLLISVHLLTSEEVQKHETVKIPGFWILLVFLTFRLMPLKALVQVWVCMCMFITSAVFPAVSTRFSNKLTRRWHSLCISCRTCKNLQSRYYASFEGILMICFRNPHSLSRRMWTSLAEIWSISKEFMYSWGKTQLLGCSYRIAVCIPLELVMTYYLYLHK